MRLRILLAVAAVAVTACSGSPAPGAAHARAAEDTYYLALGDSLSQGVQPDAAGASVKTRDGYPDQLYAALHRNHPTLQLVKLGCPGETTATMIHGGICRYHAGSQLAAAVAFPEGLTSTPTRRATRSSRAPSCEPPTSAKSGAGRLLALAASKDFWPNGHRFRERGHGECDSGGLRAVSVILTWRGSCFSGDSVTGLGIVEAA